MIILQIADCILSLKPYLHAQELRQAFVVISTVDECSDSPTFSV